jgi:hypothetical protein
MLTRSSILAFAAVALLGASALAPASASARGLTGGSFGHGGLGGGGAISHPVSFGHGGLGHGGLSPIGRLHNGGMEGHDRDGFRRRFPGFPGIVVKNPPWKFGCWNHPWAPYCHGHHWGFPPVYVDGPPVVEGGVGVIGTVGTAPVATQPSAPCTCLTKSYLQDGSVLFQDVCTKEAAVSGPATAPTAGQ